MSLTGTFYGNSKVPFWLITLGRWKALFDKTKRCPQQHDSSQQTLQSDETWGFLFPLSLQHVSPLSSEYIRGVWATESSDSGMWIEVVMNPMSNSNSWMATDKKQTRNVRDLQKKVIRMQGLLLRMFLLIVSADIKLKSSATQTGNATFPARWLYDSSWVQILHMHAERVL